MLVGDVEIGGVYLYDPPNKNSPRRGLVEVLKTIDNYHVYVQFLSRLQSGFTPLDASIRVGWLKPLNK